MYDTRTLDGPAPTLAAPDRVPSTFNQTNHEFPATSTLPDLFWQQVRARPDAVAAAFGDARLTYRELAERSTELAGYLRHLGVTPDTCVGMYVEPSLDLLVGAWGILLADAAYLPLSPEYPADRLRYMIGDCRTTVIFSQPDLTGQAAELAPAGALVVTLADAARFARQQPAAAEPDAGTALRPDHLAYLIYTSGSTGQPKGVMIEHRSIVNQMHWLRTVHGIGPATVIVQKTPMSFDAAQWEILAPCCGSTVVMGSPGIHRDPPRLIDTIQRHGVTTLQCVPTLLQALLDTEQLSRCTSLAQIFSGGEALTRALAVECFRALPDCSLVNLYGPTECTINSSAYPVDPRTVEDGPSTISIGAPVHNTRYHILDPDRAPVALGEVGELYVSGVQLARGYVHRPDLMADKFVPNPFGGDPAHDRLYRTGDLAHWNADGTVQFAGRTDNQVKLRGFRVELDEIKVAIKAHDWVKNAAVIVKNDDRTGFQNLLAFIELNPKEAALMDQGNHGAHHQSKQSRLQTRTQLSNPGVRDEAELAGKQVLDLPAKEPALHKRRQVFARKTYRFFEGGEVTAADIRRLLGRRPAGTASRLEALCVGDLGDILGYFRQYRSEDRLLPKYGYASPGSLYATQMYFEIDKVCDLEPGYYYYHPVQHDLIKIRPKQASPDARVAIHFVGKKRAIEPVYKNNIREVLEIETGHMVGLFEEVLPRYGLDIVDLPYNPAAKDQLEVAAEDYYLGTFELVPYREQRPAEMLAVYVQTHPGRVADLPAGQYEYRDGDLHWISDDLVLKKHVIAINQQVYARSSIGITLVSPAGASWRSYLDLGRKLQQLQMNDANLGFMSSGYSSESGNDLPSARRIEQILRASGKPVGPSYFAVGGRVSDEQINSEGMKEDAVHMKGPTELIRDDLVNLLPDYMIPNRVVVLDALPLTPNGKIDHKALAASEQANIDLSERPLVLPRTSAERRVAAIWARDLKREAVSVLDDFFESGGNSLIAVGLINKVNREFGASLPLQILFESPTIEQLAARVVDAGRESTRLVRLHAAGSEPPVFCWPGLGGYTMNLRLLAGRLDLERPFYGVQAHGINPGEEPYDTIREMAAADVALITHLQPRGPYTLWGYSFGARVAFEAAYQLEQAGESVRNLFLIAPGSPRVRAVPVSGPRSANYRDPAYLTILFSVFAGTISGPVLAECLRTARDEDSFAAFITERFDNLDADQVRRIARIVHQTYSFEYTFQELAERTVAAPLTIFKARGDDYSFIEGSSGYSARPPVVIDLAADHYSLLRDPDVEELLTVLRYHMRA